MSTNFKHSHRNTIDAYKQSTLNPPSSTIPSAPDMREDDISSCTTFGTISQQQEDTTTTTTRRGKKTTTVRGAAIDTITMGHAVRVPHALQSATRRTMLDILTQLNREKSVNETDECVGNSLAHGRKLLYDGVNTNKNPSILVNATTIAASTSTSHVLPDLSRSLRHLLPSRRGNAANTRQQCRQRQEELLHAEEDSISEFEDDDDNNNNNNNNVHMKKEKKRGSDETRGVQEPYLINEECLANDQTEPYSFPRTVLDREEGQRRGRHRSWAKLFNCDDLHNDDPSIQDSLHTVQQQQQQQEMPKFTPVTRVSTKSSHRSSSSLHAVWADVEDERRSSTAGRTSLATLLDAAEAEDDERRRSFSHLLAAEKTEKKGMEYEEEGENNNHSMLLLSSHTFGKPSFGAMGLSLNNGSSSSASAVAALLQGSSSTTITSTSAVVKRGGGVCRGRMSAALKQLSGNPTSARVVTYLARSFDDWRLDAPAISQFNKEMEEGRANSTLDESSKYTLLSGTSGVQLKLRVVMVENTYSIYCLRVEIVWADEQTSMELGYDYNNNNNNTTILSTTTAMEEHDDDEGESLPPCSVERNKLWTVALTTPSFQSTPIVVGEHLYLARPFFCYPSIQTIVASLNITSDSALRQPQPTRQGRRRRPREEISSQEQQQQEQKQQKQEQENDPQNCMMGYEKMSMDTTTPERPSRPAISLSAPSPFAAYDPFLNTPTNPFRKSTVDTDPSAAFSQRQQQVGRSLKMTSEEEENNNNNNNNNMSDNSISVSIQQTVKHDIIGDHFPRGPGEEWDVPLEVLLALCPIQNPAAFTSSAADADNFFSPSAVQSWMRSGGDVVSSSISSLSSVDEDDEVPPTLTNQKVSAWRYDDVLLSD